MTRHAKRRRNAIFLALLCLPLLPALLTGCQQNGKADTPPVERSTPRVATAKKESQVRGLARLEPKNGLILVGSKPGATVQEVKVALGDQVKAGDVLAILEGHRQAQAQLELAKLNKQSADFKRDLKRQQLELERTRFDRLREDRHQKLREFVEILKAKLKVAEENRARITAVEPTADRIAVQDYIINQTKGELLEAEMKLQEFETDLELLPQKRKLEDQEISDENPEQQLLTQQIRAAEAALEQTLVRAPSAGSILQIVTHAGETSSGPLFYLADTSQMVAVVELFQTDVAGIKPGDKGVVEIFDQRVPATVTHVGRMVGDNRMTSVNPMELTDRRVVEVTLDLADSTYASQYVNMQVSALIHPRTADTAQASSGEPE